MSEAQRVEAARAGDRKAFDALVAPALPRLRRLAVRMLGHPEEAADVVQDALLRAFSGLQDYRGDASFSTWLFTIVSRQCLNALRKAKRWRWDAQVDLPLQFAREVHEGPASPVRDPDFVFEAREHIAFCFTCVARSLPPQQEAALVLRDVFELTNAEAAQVVGVSVSVFRHELSRARKHMEASFDDLCAIVNKRGVCYQCSGLRGTMPARQQGQPVPTLGSPDEDAQTRYRHRLRVVTDADLEHGATAGLHELLFRRLGDLEARRTAPAAPLVGERRP